MREREEEGKRSWGGREKERIAGEEVEWRRRIWGRGEEERRRVREEERKKKRGEERRRG